NDVLISKTTVKPFRFVQRKYFLPIHADKIISIIGIVWSVKYVRLLQDRILEKSPVLGDKIFCHSGGSGHYAVADVTLTFLVRKCRIAFGQLEKSRRIEFSVSRRDKSILSHIVPIPVRVMPYIDVIEPRP